MLLSELNLKALNVNAESVLPMEQIIDVEGKRLKIKIVDFQSRYGSGKKSVVSGTISLDDINKTTVELNNCDIETVRRKISKLLGLKSKPRTTQTEVEKLRQSLGVARRLCDTNPWLIINAPALRAHFKIARKKDLKNKEEALKARAVNPILVKVAKLSAEERALLLASLQS